MVGSPWAKTTTTRPPLAGLRMTSRNSLRVCRAASKSAAGDRTASDPEARVAAARWINVLLGVSCGLVTRAEFATVIDTLQLQLHSGYGGCRDPDHSRVVHAHPPVPDRRRRSPALRSDSARVPLLGRHNPRLQRLRRIGRGEVPGLTVVDGPKLTAELAARGVPIHEVYAAPELLSGFADDPAFARLLRSGRVFAVDALGLEHASPTRSPQGVLAVVEIPERTVLTSGLVLYLDRVQDPGNVGGAIRCAAAFGADGVACSPGCADPFSPRAIRASAGHSLLLPVGRDAEFGPLAAAFAGSGGAVVATAGSGGRSLSGWRTRRPLLLALGNEGQGLAAEIVAACQETVSIPLSGGVESLNITVAAGVFLAFIAGATAPADGLASHPILDSERGRRAQ